MPNAPLQRVATYLTRISSRHLVDTLSDRELLDRFVARKDETAFAAIVSRHGAMVRSVCLRILRQDADADDAFQATFLILLRKAGSISKRESLSSWLHGVALRVSRRAKSNLGKERTLDRIPESRLAVNGEREVLLNELRLWLDRAVQKLPEQFRSSFILCCMQGKSYAQAARLLGCAEGTVSSRVVRARERLRTSLSRSGLGLTAGALALDFVHNAGPVPQALVEAVLAVMHEGSLSSQVIVTTKAKLLAQGVIKSMFMAKIKIASLIASVILVGAGVSAEMFLAHSTQAEDNAHSHSRPAPEWADNLVGVPSRHDGIIKFIGTEVTKGDTTAKSRKFSVMVDNEERTYRKLRVGDVVVTGQLLAQVDDTLPRAELMVKLAKLKAVEADKVSFEKTREESYQRWLTQKKLYSSNVRSTSLEDVRGAELTYNRCVYEAIAKEGAIKVAQEELAQAKAVVESYQIRSPVNGIIRRIHKHDGEAVRYLETVVTLQLIDDEKEEPPQ